MDVFTKPYTVPVTFDTGDGIFRMSITAQGGDISILGNIGFRGEDPEPVTIKEGGSVLLVANPNNPIHITVDPGANVAVVLIFFN